MLVKTRLEALYTQEKVACDMGKSAKTEEERQYYKEELKKIRAEIDNLTACQRWLGGKIWIYMKRI